MTTTPTDQPSHRSRAVGILKDLTLAVPLGLLLSNFTETITRSALKSLLSRVTGRYYASAAAFLTIDQSGIPFAGYTSGYGFAGKQRNPTNVANAAIDYYDKLNAKPENRQYCLNCANWLVANAVPHADYALLEYTFPYPLFRMNPPWRSSLAQGQALIALVDADRLTHDPKYLNTARMLLRAFDIPEDQGGIAVPMEGGVWFEEYAGEEGAKPRVLNGMLYALFGLHTYYEYTNDPHALQLFQQGVTAVKAVLPRFDNQGHSYYDLLGKPPGPYHLIHVEQLATLYELTHEKIFQAYHEKWAAYREPPFVTQLITRPTPMRGAIALVNILGVLLALFGIRAIFTRRK